MIDCRAGTVVGVEALARWTHESRGSISPGEFIPLAESSGLIKPLTELALATAVADCARWQAALTYEAP